MAGLLVGTAAGVYALQPASLSSPRLVGLSQSLVTHLAASQHTVLAAVPKRGPVHEMTALGTSSADKDGVPPGLHAATLTAVLQPEGGQPAAEWRQVWSGDARSCTIDVDSNTWFVGAEPADVQCSADGGAGWEGAGGFASLPSRASWSFPAPPHQPHVLSIECFRSAAGTATGTKALHVVAGVEVGGALLSADGGRGWREANEGLYVDVHSLRVDPHNSQRWYAVTGRGLYRTEDGGGSWRRLMEDLPRWYTIGLALNPQREGELLVTGGDRPPSVGVHVAHSGDGGDSWCDMTEEAFAREAEEVRGRFTPVPYFWQGRALLGTSTGHIMGSEPGGPARHGWRPLCRLPAPALCFAAAGQSPSSVMH